MFISFVTELELLAYRYYTVAQEKEVRLFLKQVQILDVNPDIKTATYKLLRKYMLKLPDALVSATAIYPGAELYSGDKQFKKISELELVEIIL